MIKHAIAALGLAFLSTTSQAQEFCGDRYCASSSPVPVKQYVRSGAQYMVADRQERIVAHPAGCPRTLFCGCGVSVRVWGKPRREFYRADAYRVFKRSIVAAGNVAWRYRRGGGHAVYIEEVISGNVARVYDPNSGGHKTRIQVLDLTGWNVVSPKA